MSVLVRGIDLPLSCGGCPFYTMYESCRIESHGCVDRYGLPANRKPQWCPLEYVDEEKIND